jgi:hypothetical protein
MIVVYLEMSIAAKIGDLDNYSYESYSRMLSNLPAMLKNITNIFIAKANNDPKGNEK